MGGGIGLCERKKVEERYSRVRERERSGSRVGNKIK